MRRKWLSCASAISGKASRPRLSSSAGVSRARRASGYCRSNASPIGPCMSAACACTDFLQTSGKCPASFTMPPRCPPIPSAQVLQALRWRIRRYSRHTPPAFCPMRSVYAIAATPPPALTRGLAIGSSLLRRVSYRMKGPAPGRAGPFEGSRSRLERQPRHELERPRRGDAVDRAEAVVVDEVPVRVVRQVRDAARQARELRRVVHARELRVDRKSVV